MFIDSIRGRVVFLAVLVAALLLLARHEGFWQGGDLDGGERIPSLEMFSPASSAELKERLNGGFDSADPSFLVEECGVVLPAPERFPPDLIDLGVSEKKNLFVNALFPHIIYQNALIRKDRREIEECTDALRAGQILDPEKKSSLGMLFSRYRLSSLTRDDKITVEDLQRLLVRVDVVPPSLVLAQAAVESGWGTSRFVREGNNLFGHWQFQGPPGIVPKERPEGESYTLARFEHLSRAVELYLMNLNTHWAYKPLRQLRAEARRNRKRLNAERLAGGLSMYSTRREAYVEDIIRIMRQNNLLALDRAKLSMC